MWGMWKMRSAVTLLALVSVPTMAAPWPAVQPMERTFQIDAGSPVSITVPIQTRAGSTAYILSCSSGDGPSPDDIGSFLCALNEPGHENNESTLLAEDESPPWHSRGQFHMAELVGECATYPEYGTRRSFRLRGMHLALMVSHVQPGSNGIAHLTLRVRVRPEPSARGEWAQRPRYLPPKFGKCRPIRKGNEPLMCRDWKKRGGSWTECKNIGV
jgi:hypothetical protein